MTETPHDPPCIAVLTIPVMNVPSKEFLAREAARLGELTYGSSYRHTITIGPATEVCQLRDGNRTQEVLLVVVQFDRGDPSHVDDTVWEIAERLSPLIQPDYNVPPSFLVNGERRQTPGTLLRPT